MTIRKFLLQISFIFALIIGLTACEKVLTLRPFVMTLNGKTTMNGMILTGKWNVIV